MLCTGDAYILSKIFNGITVGDLALYAMGNALGFNYYDDCKWYSSDKDGNLTKFNVVLSAIFEYQIGSKEPLALNEMQLEMCGDTPVITYFESQFGISISSLINNPPAELSSLLPEGIRSFLSRCIALTVRDLYNLTCGDFTFVYEFIEMRNSSLFSVFSIRSFTSVIASMAFMSARNLRRIHMRSRVNLS